MPKRRKYESVQCQFFSWRLIPRGGIWYADGRSNKSNRGRHSLGTSDRGEALQLLAKLDRQRAVKLGLAKPSLLSAAVSVDAPLPLDEGRQLYEKHIKRPLVAGGTKDSTQKRYRAVFDKFLPFAKNHGVETWNAVDIDVVHAYASHLDNDGYAGKTIRNELVTIGQAHRFLLAKKHLSGAEPLKLELKKVESERPHCYTREQISAMVKHCRANPELAWLEHVIVGLTTTGLRISELAGLKWGDIDLAAGHLKLTDESGRAIKKGDTKRRRQLKSGRSRCLPIYPDLATTLAALPRIDAYVFHGPHGGRLKPDTVRRCLVRDVIEPLAEQFPSPEGEQGFADARLHSFRHYFASTCANSGVAELVTMEWLGHADSDMVRHYYHLHDQESRRQMNRLDLLGEAGQQRPGVQGAAPNQEAASQESDPTIATSGRD